MTTQTVDERVYDLIVVGAGVAGLGPAWRLAEQGYDILVVDKNMPGHGASSAAAGMLAPHAEVHFHEDALLHLQRASLEMYPDFVADLQACSSMDIEYRTEGTLVLALDRDEAEAVDRVYQYQRALGLDVRWVTTDDVHAMEPHLVNVHSGVFCAQDYQINNAYMVDALLKAVKKHGATVVDNTGVASIWIKDGAARGVILEDGQSIAAKQVLVAAGAWSGRIEGIPELQRSRIRPVRGQMIAIDGGTPPLCRHVIRTEDAYLVPKNDGSLLIGATSEEKGFDASYTAGGIFELLRGAWRIMPGVYDQTIIDIWTGFRPMSLDNHPILGPSTVQNLWLSTGHGRHGILLTPMTAHLMSDMIQGKSVSPRYHAFLPTR